MYTYKIENMAGRRPTFTVPRDTKLSAPLQRDVSCHLTRKSQVNAPGEKTTTRLNWMLHC